MDLNPYESPRSPRESPRSEFASRPYDYLALLAVLIVVFVISWYLSGPR